MTAASEIEIGRPGWDQVRRLACSPPSMSWRTDGPGTFNATLSTDELLDWRMPPASRTGLKGKWLWYEHPIAGAWGGVITATSVRGAFTDITAEDFAVLLRKRRTAANYRAQSASPGTMALVYITSAERAGDYLGLTAWTADESGDPIDYDPRGGDLADEIIPELAEFGYQWRVLSRTKDERWFDFRPRLGADLRRTVHLLSGRHIVAESEAIDGDLWTVANAISGVAGDQQFEVSRGYFAENRASVKALGRRYETQIAYDGAATRSTIVPLIKKDLAAMAYPAEICTVDVTAADDTWRLFREGDVIRVTLAAAGADCPMTVDVRSLDVGTGVLTISGELLTTEI